MKFQKGVSGNPTGKNAGRPPMTPQAREAKRLAQEATPDAVRKLIAMMEDPDPHVSIKACIAILDRGLGKPPQAVQITDERNPGDEVADLPRQERIALLEDALAAELAAAEAERAINGRAHV